MENLVRNRRLLSINNNQYRGLKGTKNRRKRSFAVKSSKPLKPDEQYLIDYGLSKSKVSKYLKERNKKWNSDFII